MGALITRRKRREFDVFKPHKYTVSRGVPDYARTEIKKILTPKGENYIIYSVKSQNFDEIVFFSAGSENSSVRVAHFVFEITLSVAITLTLLLVCSFSPRVHSIPRGPRFSRIFGFRKNAEKAQIIAFYTRDMYSPVRVSTLIVSPWFTKKGTWMI